MMDDPKITHNKPGTAINGAFATDHVDSEIDPAQYLRPDGDDGGEDTALIILNSPIAEYDILARLYNNSEQIICADGGANRLRDLLLSTFPDLKPHDALEKALPTCIHGDLDSLRDDVRNAYSNLAIPISHDGDEYSTDFGKSVSRALSASPSTKTVLVLGSLSGRVDQGLGILHELYREQLVRHPGVQFFLFSESSISTVLAPGVMRISTDLGERLLGRSVGILPVFGKAVISTRGLEWDVREWETEMGEQVSTSNHVVGESFCVKVEGEGAKGVLFTIELGEKITKGSG